MKRAILLSVTTAAVMFAAPIYAAGSGCASGSHLQQAAAEPDDQLTGLETLLTANDPAPELDITLENKANSPEETNTSSPATGEPTAE